MKELVLVGYNVQVDEDVTREWYEHSDGWNCICGHCRNFIMIAKRQMLPDSILDVLNELGIPPEKPTYLSELYQDDAGIHYQFSYRIAGVILEKEEIINNGAARCTHEIYPYGAPSFPEPHFDLEFYAVLPWILNEG